MYSWYYAYSCTGRGLAGLHAAAQWTCAWIPMSTLLHLHANHDTDSCSLFYAAVESQPNVLHLALCRQPWPVGDRQRPFTARKTSTRKTLLLEFKTQRKGDTPRSRTLWLNIISKTRRCHVLISDNLMAGWYSFASARKTSTRKTLLLDFKTQRKETRDVLARYG